MYKCFVHITACVLGRILNRFSKDIGFMDDVLPHQFMELFTVSGITHL